MDTNINHLNSRKEYMELVYHNSSLIFGKKCENFTRNVSRRKKNMTNTEKNIVLAALSSYRRKLMDQSVSFLRAGNHEDAKQSTIEAANVNALVIKFTREKEFAI